MTARDRQAHLPLRTFLIRLCGIVVVLLMGALSASTLAQSKWVTDYGNYDKNQFALKVPITDENTSRLEQRLEIYRHHIMFFKKDALTSAGDGAVRLGFFPSIKDAQDLLSASKFLIKGQRVERVPQDAHLEVIKALAVASKESANSRDYFVLVRGQDIQDSANFTAMAVLDYAKNLYMDKRYAEAERYYFLLSLMAEEKNALWATELRGLCQEKMGNKDKALALYQSLIDRDLSPANKDRVQQRLNGLQTAASDGSEALRKSSYTNENKIFFYRGTFGQTQNSITRTVTDQEPEEVLSILSTDFDFRASGKVRGHEIKLRTNGYHLLDQLDSEDSRLRLKRAHIDYEHAPTGLNVGLGRQRKFDSGAFTSFDGVSLSYPLLNNVRVGASAGRPVYFGNLYDNLDHLFFSGSAKWIVNKSLQTNVYYMHQTVNGELDRQAIGLGAQWLYKKFYTAMNIDYDLNYNLLNNLVLNARLPVTKKLDVSATWGSQRSPFLAATNIFIGQPSLNLDVYLRDQRNRNNLYFNALVRTPLNNYGSLSVTQHLSKTTKLIFDYYFSHISEIPSDELLQGLPFTSEGPQRKYTQFSYGLRLMADGFFYRTDIFSGGVRQHIADKSEVTQFYFNERLRIGSKFTIIPHFSYSYMRFGFIDNIQEEIRYSGTLSYKPWRNTEFRVEFGNELLLADLTTFDINSTYLFASYRVHF